MCLFSADIITNICFILTMKSYSVVYSPIDMIVLT